MISGLLANTALFLAGTVYVILKLREDIGARRRPLVALGIAALFAFLIALAFCLHGLLVLLGF